MNQPLPPRYDLAFTLYPYAKSPDQDLPPIRHRVVIVGGGPIGLATALDLGRQGVPVLLLGGHSDPLVSEAKMRALHDALTGADHKLILFEAGHLATHQQ